MEIETLAASMLVAAAPEPIATMVVPVSPRPRTLTPARSASPETPARAVRGRVIGKVAFASCSAPLIISQPCLKQLLERHGLKTDVQSHASPLGSVSFTGSSPVYAYGCPVLLTNESTLRNWPVCGSE